MDQEALIANCKRTLVNENFTFWYNAEQPTYYESATAMEEIARCPRL